MSSGNTLVTHNRRSGRGQKVPVSSLQTTGSKERGVFGVGSIPVAILPSIYETIAL